MIVSRLAMGDWYSRSARWIRGASLLAGGLLFASPAHAQCKADADCGAAKVCISGSCQPATMSCAADADCPGDEVCDRKRCQAPTPTRAKAPGPVGGPPLPVAAPPGAGPAPGGSPELAPVTYAAPPEKGEKRRSTGMMVGGIVTLGVGGVSLIAGLVTIAAAQNAKYSCNYSDYTDSCRFDTDEGAQAAGIVITIIGGAAVAVGLPLLLVGASKVPVEEASAWYAPDVRLGLQGGSARWRF